ncbi:MAG: DUF445 domain-containing protein [Acidimicrobiales bacterium]
MDPAETDQTRRLELRRMKGVALGLLAAAAVVYVITTIDGGDGVVGYVRAFAEAAMVGALADWFAVTALFRHPLRLPIPHTAIIPNRKDALGRSLGDFVETNFLTEEVLAERLAQARAGHRIGSWLSDPANSERASRALGEVIEGALEILDDDEVQRGLESIVQGRIAAAPASSLLSKAIEASVQGGHHTELLDAVIDGLHNLLGDNEETFRRRIYEESPWWVPESLDDRVYDKIHEVLRRFLSDVRADPDHALRRTVANRLGEFADRLEDDPAMIANGERLKQELLDHPEFRAWVDSLWVGAKASLVAAADDPDSPLRSQTAEGLQRFGARLVEEPALQRKVDDWLARAVGYLVDNYRREVSDVIAATTERWDGETTARKVELQVGRDLQFIRINGTIVGGLAGITIHAVGELLAG